MDPQLLVNFLNEFDELRMNRISVAQKFVAQYDNLDELYADVANVLALLFAANQIQQTPKGFKSDAGGFRAQ